MRKIRIISQTTFFAIFAFLFVFINKYPIAYNIDSDFFLKLNPFTSLLVTIASHRLILNFLLISGFVAVASILFGRMFCGFICPLGSMIDLVDKVFTKVRSSRRRPPLYLHRLKFAFLTVLILLAIFGVISPLFMDPIPLATRIFTFLFDPFIRIFISDAQHSVSYFSQSAANHLYMTMPVRVPLYFGGSLTLLLVFILFGGTFWDRRFWCQYVCPTGAFLGLIGHFSFFRRNVNVDKCNSCTACAKKCPVRAISEKDVLITSVTECIECGLCAEITENCSSFGIVKKPGSLIASHPDYHRRHLVAGIAGGALLVPVVRSSAIFKRDDQGRLIRPPGALPEQEFLKQCLACGECMKACPTNTLQPAMFSDGFSRLYTPKVVPRVAGCEAKCALCGNVCPTGAIRKITPDEKPFVKIGTAVLDRHRCLAWEQNKECVVCDEVCPFNAIDTRELQTTDGKFKVPVVKEDLCMGCGMCEQHCPISDFAAITVYRFGENRRSSGPYMSEWQKKSFVEQRKKTGMEKGNDAYHENSSGAYGNGNIDESKSQLPEGFLE